MIRRPASLRARLTGIILAPTPAIGIEAGFRQLRDARATADEVFDRSHPATALAVERDVAIPAGDALSLPTRDLLANTSGGRVFCDVYGPDGVSASGYATPLVGAPRAEELPESIEELSQLAEGLPVLDRAEGIGPEDRREGFDLADNVAGWLGEARQKAPNGISISAEVSGPCLVHADRTMLREAFRNRLANAFFHGGPGLSRIHGAPSSKPGAGLCRLVVADNGTGMTKAQRARAADRFQSAPCSAGAGLGLAVFAAVARAHRGRLSPEDAGRGRRVVLALPPDPAHGAAGAAVRSG